MAGPCQPRSALNVGMKGLNWSIASLSLSPSLLSLSSLTLWLMILF